MRKQDATRALEINVLNVQVLRDSEGYLVDTDDWSEDFSEMAANE